MILDSPTLFGELWPMFNLTNIVTNRLFVKGDAIKKYYKIFFSSIFNFLVQNIWWILSLCNISFFPFSFLLLFLYRNPILLITVESKVRIFGQILDIFYSWFIWSCFAFTSFFLPPKWSWRKSALGWDVSFNKSHVNFF